MCETLVKNFNSRTILAWPVVCTLSLAPCQQARLILLIKNSLSAWVNRLLHSEEQPDLNFTLQVWKDYEQSRDEMLTELGALSLTLKRQPQHRDQVKQRLDYNAEKVGLLHRISFQCESN